LEELTVSWNGIDLRFSRRSAPRLERVDARADAASISFEGDARLALAYGEASQGSLQMTLSAPSGSDKARILSAGYTVAGIALPSGSASALRWEREGRRFSMTLPAGARIDPARRLIEVPVQAAAGSRAILFSEAGAAAPAAPTVAALPDEKSLPGIEEMSAAVARFLDAAYKGWTGARLLPADGLWRMPDGSNGFAEDIGTALLAESLARGAFADQLALWSDAFERQLQKERAAPLDYETCAYTGAVKEYQKRRQEREQTDIARIREILGRSDPAVFTLQGLVPFVLDSADQSLARELLGFMMKARLSGLDPSPSVGLLECLLDYATWAEQSEGCLPRITELIEKNALPAIKKTDKGLFYAQRGGGRVDVRESLLCGSLLLRAGSLLDARRFAAFGRGLVSSALGMGRDSGFLPATLLVSSGRVTSQQGTLGAESIYGYLPIRRLIPREVPLLRQAGPGAWIWTAAEVSGAEGSSDETRLVLSFPRGQPHHFILRGIRPFAEIRLHGIPWHADPFYFRYSDGWAYDAASRTLFMKLTGKKDSEELIIRY
jgi:hypothetical protein